MNDHKGLTIQHIGDTTVVSFVNNKILDEETVQAIAEELFAVVEQLGRKNIVVNFGNLQYLSSPALGKLIQLTKKIKVAGYRLTLCNIDPQIAEVFAVIGLM